MADKLYIRSMNRKVLEQTDSFRALHDVVSRQVGDTVLDTVNKKAGSVLYVKVGIMTLVNAADEI